MLRLLRLLLAREVLHILKTDCSWIEKYYTFSLRCFLSRPRTALIVPTLGMMTTIMQIKNGRQIFQSSSFRINGSLLVFLDVRKMSIVITWLKMIFKANTVFFLEEKLVFGSGLTAGPSLEVHILTASLP